MAHWLDKTFLPFDRKIFAWMHALEQKAGGFFNGFCKFVSFFGEMGWFFIVSAFVFLLFKRMRREGLGMAFALVIGAIVTNILLKNIVGRARPFTREGTPFRDWWIAAGSNPEDSASFPSGHTTAAFASMVAFFLLGDKRYSFAGLVFAFLMGFSRIYLIVHYPTDVLAGLLIGTLAGVGGTLLCKLVYKKAGGKFRTLLYEGSIVTLCRRLLPDKHRTAEPQNAPFAEAPSDTPQEKAEESEPPTKSDNA